MMCHAPGNEFDTDMTAKTLGFAMEGWKVGDTHGAYEIVVPSTPRHARRGFIANGLWVSVPIATRASVAFSLRRLTKPINQLIAMVRDIATGEGDLTKRINLDRKDEIGQFAGWFNAFLDNLHKLIGEIRGVTTQVSRLRPRSPPAARRWPQDHPAGRADHAVPASTEEMAASADEVSRSIEGKTVVEQTVDEIEQIAREVTGSAAVVGELGKKGDEIGQIILVINDIADQTNLALNAAIEARGRARARGFAVADEVRKLAERTTVATEQVATSIKEIQTGTTAAVERMGPEGAPASTSVRRRSPRASSLLRSSSPPPSTTQNIEQINAVTQKRRGASQAASAAATLSVESGNRRRCRPVQTLINQVTTRSRRPHRRGPDRPWCGPCIPHKPKRQTKTGRLQEDRIEAIRMQGRFRHPFREANAHARPRTLGAAGHLEIGIRYHERRACSHARGSDMPRDHRSSPTASAAGDPRRFRRVSPRRMIAQANIRLTQASPRSASLGAFTPPTLQPVNRPAFGSAAARPARALHHLELPTPTVVTVF